MTATIHNLNERHRDMMRELFPIPESDGGVEGHAVSSRPCRGLTGDADKMMLCVTEGETTSQAGIKPGPSDQIDVSIECAVMFAMSALQCGADPEVVLAAVERAMGERDV